MVSNHSLVTSNVILSAIAGDSLSMSIILSHYGHYINSFCIRNIYDDNRNMTVQIDDFTRRQLETKLIDAILKFEVRTS